MSRQWPRFAAPDVEIDRVIATMNKPGCPKCGCLHDDRITTGRKDSCYREARPMWWLYPYMIDRDILRRLLERAAKPQNRRSVVQTDLDK